MSFTNIRPYFRTRLDSLGFREWPDAFNIDNNPSSIIDLSYHLGPVQVSTIQQNQGDLESDGSISVHLWVKGYADPSVALDDSLTNAQSILVDVLKASNRIGGNLKNVFLDGIATEPIAGSNDNVVRLRLDFRCRTILATE